MKNERIPELYLEQALLDELPDEKRSLLDGDSAAARLDELEQSNSEILKKYDPASMMEQILEKLESSKDEEDHSNIKTGWFGSHRTGVLLAAAALAIFAGTSPFLFRQSPSIELPTPGTEITRIKGMDPGISLYRKLDGTVEQLIDGAVAREADLIQISYNAAGKPFGMIFSIDGRGVVSLHFPKETKGSLVLKREGEVALDFSYRLDDAPRFEQFFFITSDRTFDIGAILKAAEKLSGRLILGEVDPGGETIDLPDGLDHTALLIRKEVSK
jgi:hypothetical protein